MPGIKRLQASRFRGILASAGLALAGAVALMPVATFATGEPATPGSPTTFRRLNETQYTRSIEDIFGPGIKIPGRFEPPLRDEGLLAIGDANVVITPSGVEQYELRAREIAAQVLAQDRRAHVMPCTPASPDNYDAACARQFAGKYGRLLYRRPLTADETAAFLKVTQTAAEKAGSFYKGLEVGLSRLLISSHFVFRSETSEPDPGRRGARRLDAYSLAARLSFLIWDAPPDEALLDAAGSGALYRIDGLQDQIDRMLASPKFEQGVRSLFSDMFGYDQFDGLSKDPAIYPRYSSQLAKDAKEQSLRTIVDLLVTNRGDYRDLFTTKKTFLNRNLAALYMIPLNKAAVEGWEPYTFAPEDPRAGLLTLPGFLMLDPTHEGKTSPTIRGKAVRELFLCQKIPPPPGNVDFSKFEDPKNANLTARDRLTAHRDNPACAGCHSITDPLGLAMENYDGVGEHRTRENGATIDATGTFDGKPYQDLLSLEQVLHDSPTVPACLVQRVYEYGAGHAISSGEHDWLEFINRQFAANSYGLAALVRQVASSKAFRAVSPSLVASN